MTIGFSVNPRNFAAQPEMVVAFSKVPVANISDSMNRMYAGGSTIRPFTANANMAGQAITVLTRPGDNLMIHKALDMAQEGDVIVVDAGGDTTNALIGELMLETAVQKKLAGLVLNGAIRDLDAFAISKMPCFAIGVTHRGPYKDGPGEINVPISIGGMVIEPGDIVVGDRDGFLAIPKQEAKEILAAAQLKHETETQQMEKIRSGTADRSWVNKSLREKGVLISD